MFEKPSFYHGRPEDQVGRFCVYDEAFKLLRSSGGTSGAQVGQWKQELKPQARKCAGMWSCSPELADLSNSMRCVDLHPSLVRIWRNPAKLGGAKHSLLRLNLQNEGFDKQLGPELI